MKLEYTQEIRSAAEWFVSKCMSYLDGRINQGFPCVHYTFF